MILERHKHIPTEIVSAPWASSFNPTDYPVIITIKGFVVCRIHQYMEDSVSMSIRTPYEDTITIIKDLPVRITEIPDKFSRRYAYECECSIGVFPLLLVALGEIRTIQYRGASSWWINNQN